MKQYVVIEHFAPGCKGKIYERFHEKGRILPEGLIYINSWLNKDGDRCFKSERFCKFAPANKLLNA
jgi:hypothetical protein